MSRLRNVLLFVFISLNWLCFAQKKENIYLLYNTVEDTCHYSPHRDGKNAKTYIYEPKFRFGCFTFCNQYFSMKPNTLIGEVSKEELKKLNVKDIDYFMRTMENNKHNQLTNPNKIFNQIYVLIPNTLDSFFRIEVYWKEVYINSDLEELKLISN